MEHSSSYLVLYLLVNDQYLKTDTEISVTKPILQKPIPILHPISNYFAASLVRGLPVNSVLLAPASKTAEFYK